MASFGVRTASKGELQGLPHIGSARAEAIIQGRPWAGVAELVQLSGIGPARMAGIRNSKILCE